MKRSIGDEFILLRQSKMNGHNGGFEFLILRNSKGLRRFPNLICGLMAIPRNHDSVRRVPAQRWHSTNHKLGIVLANYFVVTSPQSRTKPTPTNIHKPLSL